MTEPSITRVVARVRGRVQGVTYRASAAREARRRGLAGWVRNEPDGSVLVDVEGEPAALAAFLDWCSQGPAAARVDEIERTSHAPVGYQGFTIG
jgi:acylphosphatase